MLGENQLEIGKNLKLDMEMRAKGLGLGLGLHSVGHLVISFYHSGFALRGSSHICLTGKEGEKGDICLAL